MTHPRSRRLLAVVAFSAAAVAIACGDPYQHTNPYDPVFPVEISIVGPDTLFSLGEFAQFTAKTNPDFGDSAIAWSIDTAAQLYIGTAFDTLTDGGVYLSPGFNSGSFQSLAPPLEPTTAVVKINAAVGGIDTTYVIAIPGTDPVRNQTIQEKFYRHYATKTLVVTQRVARIQLRCPASHACDTVSAGGAWSVWVDGWDALNRQIASLTSSTANPSSGPPVVTYTVRDTTVARSSPVGIRATTITALKTGATWVVATRGALADSLQLVVK